MGATQVCLSRFGLVLSGRDHWPPDAEAVAFESDDSVLSTFLTLRAVLLSGGRVGTEVWIHLEGPATSTGHHMMAALEQTAEAGLARMQHELNRT